MQARTVICVLEREGVRGGLARELRAIGTRVACGSARRPVRSEGRSGRRERVLLAGSATGRSLCARGTSPATRQTQAHALPLNARRVRIWRTSANLRAPGPGGVSLHSHTAATAHQRARARMPTDPAPDIGPDRASTSLHCGSAPPSGTQHNPGQHAGRGQCAELLHDCKSGSRVFLFFPEVRKKGHPPWARSKGGARQEVFPGWSLSLAILARRLAGMAWLQQHTYTGMAPLSTAGLPFGMGPRTVAAVAQVCLATRARDPRAHMTKLRSLPSRARPCRRPRQRPPHRQRCFTATRARKSSRLSPSTRRTLR